MKAQELLRKMLTKNPRHRPSFEEVLEHKFFVEAGKTIHDTALSFVKQYYFNRTSSIKEKKSFESERKKYDRKDSSFDSKVGSKIESNFDYGTFQVGRSNFFRGNMDTVPEVGLLSPGTQHNLTPNSVGPHLTQYSEGSPGMANRKSSFSRQSMKSVGGRDIMSLRDHHMMRDNPSISISIHRDVNENSKGASFQDEGLLSKSSRTNSKLQSNASRNGISGQSLQNGIHEESSEDSLIDPDGEYSPIHRTLPRLRSQVFRNPFNEDENNDESLLYLKVGHLKSNSAKSISNSKVFEDRRSFSRLHKSSKASDSDTDSVISSKIGKRSIQG